MITGAGYLSFSDVTNSSYHKNSNLGDSNKATGCYIVTDSNLLPTSSWTVEQLEENGYYGNDGTVIGPLGGSRGTPYTLVPVVPRVTESSLSVNPQEKKLNVSVTVTPK